MKTRATSQTAVYGLLFVVAAFVSNAAATTPSTPLAPEEIQRAFERTARAVCVLNYSLEITNSQGEVNRRNAYAPGLLVSSDGLVLANGHMLLDNRRPENIRVTVGSGTDRKEYAVTLLEKPDDINLTLLRIETEEPVTFPHVEFTDRELELGEPVMIIGLLGNSFDHAKSFVERRIGAILDEPRRTYVLDESISFAYAGGPAIDRQGNVVGVIGFDLSASEGGDLYTRSGHPHLFHSALFQRHIDAPPTAEGEDNAWLGIFTQPLTDEFAEYWDLPKNGGIVVSTVIPNSPAAAAGFESGDVIIGFNENPVNVKDDQSTASFLRMVRESPIGSEIPIRLYRDGEPMEIRMELGTRPTRAADAPEYEEEVFGFTVRELTTDIRIALNLSEDVQGIIVRRVKSGSPGHLAQIRPGYIILALGPYETPNIDAYKEAIAVLQESQPREIPVFCRVGPTTAFFRLQPRWAAE